MTARPLRALLLALLVVALWGSPAAAEQAEDYAISGGRAFPQTGGFSVADEGGIPFWSEFRRLGGVSALGYPVSGRYEVDGYVHQAFQKAILQWRPDQGRTVLTNVLDDLHRAGKDDWLLNFRQTPKQLPPEFDRAQAWEEVVKARQALLDVDPAIKQRYFSVSDPITFFGLPTSKVEDMGNHLAVRLQRAVIQKWKVDVPWANAGETTVANAGDLAREAGLIAAPALKSGVAIVEGRADKVPWSGWWWPVDEGIRGPHLFDVNGPLARYDQLARVRGIGNVAVRAWELANVRLVGGLYDWAGHCNGWAAAAILEPEPVAPRTIDGVTFSVADQKGLLASWHFADGVEWIFGDEENGVTPSDFHRALVQWLGAGKRAFVVNAFAGSSQVFNFPAYRFRVVYTPDAADPAKTHVRATVWFVDYNVDPNFVGVKDWPSDAGRTYEYYLVGDRDNPSGGAWEGASAGDQRFARPWQIWYPNPIQRNTSRPLTSPQLDYATIRAILDAQ